MSVPSLVIALILLPFVCLDSGDGLFTWGENNVQPQF